MAEPPAVTSVGVAGDRREPVLAAFRDAGLAVTDADRPGDLPLESASTDGVDLLCTVGASALGAAARLRPAVPVLVVDGPRGTLDVPRHAVDAAAQSVADGEWQARERPLLGVSHRDRSATALCDVTLLADATGISEYAVETGDDGERQPVDRVRADGVVVATAAGSQGYAHDAGGPCLGPDVAATSVVPVGPFTVDRDRWVLTLPVWVTVEREESAVSLSADGRRAWRVTPGAAVTVSRGGSMSLVAVDARRAHFRRADRLEKT